MKLYRWQGAVRNFGDELNTLLWPRLLPSFFDDDPRSQFLGIGSILDARHPRDVVKIVAGAGYGGYEIPARLDPSWRIHFVRGPHTARIYGLAPQLALGDPASLISHALEVKTTQTRRVGFIPHFESVMRGRWTNAAEAADVHLIDPTGDPAAIISDIASCRLVISEALHGVIVADALRVPWIAARPLNPIHRAKWHDWANALPLRIRFQGFPASSFLEQTHASVLARSHLGRKLLDRHAGSLRQVASERYLARATATLTSLALHAPQLSEERALDRCQTRMLERLQTLHRETVGQPGLSARPEASAWKACISHLRPLAESAYHAP